MKLTFSTLVIALLCLGCANDDEIISNERTLPPITQNGANTLGCYIDDILFTPREDTFNGNRAVYFIGGYPEVTSYYEINARDFKSEKTASLFMHIQAVDANGIGDYIVNESNGSTSIDGMDHTYMHCRVWREDVGNFQHYLSYENSGIITITNYSLSGRMIAGTFSGSVRNYEEPHDTIQITQGRFDFKWDTLDEADFP
jgi:hypothetical protein